MTSGGNVHETQVVEGRRPARGRCFPAQPRRGRRRNDPLPVPKGTPRARAVKVYNEGVKLMRDKHYAAAQEKFEQALALDEGLAEAHNNLAFSLRLQGRTTSSAR